MSNIITCEELKQLIGKGAVVVDVMTPEDFAACHLAGASNACVYEMVFLDRIAECAPGRETELIVYDQTGTTRTAEVARERLLRAGYSKVSILSGGLSAWREAGLPVEKGEGEICEPLPGDGSYRIDPENSRLEWIGRNLNNRHFGRIDIQEGDLVIAGGRLSAGSIVLDMNTISNLDQQDPVWRDMLITHLKSDDFFGVKQFPLASFTLAGWEEQEVALSEALNGSVTGDLSIRDVTRRVSFPAIVAPQPDGSIKAHAAFDIDRTLWNVNYGSCRLFERLGMHLVHDLISLELFVVAHRA
jgi:rhodanese-related sulfurtransferase/polyisoprenoid-binding protein YceI